MYLLLTTYKVAPMTFWDYAIPLAAVFFLIYLCVKIDKGLKEQQAKIEAEARRRKRHQERRTAPSLPSKPISV
jgi:hypothetical protein